MVNVYLRHSDDTGLDVSGSMNNAIPVEAADSYIGTV